MSATGLLKPGATRGEEEAPPRSSVDTRRDRRLSVTFADSTYRVLEDLAERKRKSMAEVLRDALALENYAQRAVEEGSQLLIRQKDGQVQELLLR